MSVSLGPGCVLPLKKRISPRIHVFSKILYYFFGTVVVPCPSGLGMRWIPLLPSVLKNSQGKFCNSCSVYVMALENLHHVFVFFQLTSSPDTSYARYQSLRKCTLHAFKSITNTGAVLFLKFTIGTETLLCGTFIR